VDSTEPIEVFFEKEISTSDKSVLFRFTCGTEAWIPRSQIKRQVMYDDGSGAISIPEWLALDRGVS